MPDSERPGSGSRKDRDGFPGGRQKNTVPVYDVLYGYYMANHREGDAEQLLKNKIAANPGNVLFRLQLARYYLDARKEAEMSGVLKQVLNDAKDFPDGRLAVGDFYAANNRADDALAAFQSGAAQSGKQKAIYQLRSASLLAAMGKPEQALPIIADILKTDPHNFDARALRANIRLRSGSRADLDATFSELSELAKERPQNALIRFNLGRAWLAKGNTQAALAEFQESLRQDPQLLQAKALAADTSMRTGDYEQATRYSDDLMAQTGGKPAARLLRAAALTGMGNFDQANREVSQLNQEFPNAVEPKLELAALRLAQKRYAEAEQIYRALYEANRKDLRPLYGLMNTLFTQQHYDAATQFLNQEKQRPGAPTAELDVMLADAALRGRKLDDAVQRYSRLAQANPDSEFDHLKLGDSYLQKGDTQQAVSEFAAAKKPAPGDLQANAMLALGLQQAGKNADAESAYRATLAIQPDDPLVKNNLAYLLAEKGGNLDEALRLAQDATRLQPASAPLADTLAYVYIKKNLPDSAIQILSNASRKDPNHPAYHYHMALALLQKGDKSGARRECTAALAGSPDKGDEQKIRTLLAGLP